ncbi:pirin family protein [Pontibacter oryzae]|uniref:Pirin family protein n=1 Tax=Pontibacter oryzae TaxID=2304593 RepID=A0A399SEH6_9BACT|nr:pirin family protein [Pontibacter oryzae]RIJ42496.1 pirin family protein [Pontibacter oryzae]
MQKKISFSNTAQSSSVGGTPISRFLPNGYTQAVGPFILLDQAGPMKINSSASGGTGPHPHRGIATLTYAITGQIEHFDSLGNHALVSSGGVQWMNSGNGIVHDERSKASAGSDQKEMYAFQFWINLPSKIKAEKPEYLPVHAEEVPKKQLAEEAGVVRVIVGSYQELTSKIPTYTKQFLFHVVLNSGKKFSIDFSQKLEVAAVLPTASAIINEESFRAGELIAFDKEAGVIEIENLSDETLDILLFGGETYGEPMVSQGPFVMNSQEGVALAYEDYANGKYGEIHYP